jgi:hypothetical protein
MWNHLSVVHTLQIPIPIRKKENLGSTRKFIENHLLFLCIALSERGSEEPF